MSFRASLWMFVKDYLGLTILFLLVLLADGAAYPNGLSIRFAVVLAPTISAALFALLLIYNYIFIPESRGRVIEHTFRPK